MRTSEFVDTRKFTFNGNEFELVVTDYYDFAHLHLFLPPEEFVIDDWNPVIEAATIARKEWDRIRWLIIDLEMLLEPCDDDSITHQYIDNRFANDLNEIIATHQYVPISLIEITNVRKMIERLKAMAVQS